MGDLGTVLSAAQVLFAAVDSSSVKEACSIFRYKSNLEDLKRSIISIKSLLIDAGQRTRLSEYEDNYIKTLEKAVYDADDLFDKFRSVAERNQLLKNGKFLVKVHKFFSSQNQVKVACQIYHGVKKVRNNLNDIADDHTRFGFRVDVQPLRRIKEETHSSFYAHDIVGREDETREIVSRLLDSNEDVSFLTIVGVGGLGKTTLAKLVFGDKRVESEFDLKLWVCVSDQDGARLDLKVILLKILESAECKLDNNSTTQHVQTKYQHILGSKKFFLVLDDIWNEDVLKWKRLKKLLMISGIGSRILVTTRSDITAKIIGNGTHNTHYLKGLSEENSWRLFKMNAFEYGSPIFVDIGKRIVAKCSNLPLAIKVVGSLLCGHPIDKWHAIEMNGLAGISNGENELMSILKFSYDNLEPCSKSCFAYCAIFPKNFVINKELLMNLWDAQGYILRFDEGQSIESAREQQFSILLHRCFFHDVKKNEYGDIVSFKIHDLMHDIAQSVTKNEIHVINSSNIISNEENNNARHIFESRDNIKDDFFTKSKTRSYLRFQEYKFHDVEPFPVGEMVKKWKYLRALALNRICVEVLPDSIGNLLHLRFLSLANNKIKKLPESITKLYNLQTLNLSNCDGLEEWPKKFYKLINLTHLYRDCCDELSYMPVGMSKLTHLAVLTDFVVKDETVGGMQHVAQLRDLKSLAVNLKGRISIHFHANIKIGEDDQGDWEGSCLEGSENLKEVLIRFNYPCYHPHQGNDEERKTEEGLMDKLLPSSDLIKFELHYYNGEKIASWGIAQVSWTAYLPNLVYIKLSYCLRLRQLPLLSKLLHLKSLSLCHLADLEYMEEDETSNSGYWGSSKVVFFPALEFLEIESLLKLKGWSRSWASWIADGSINHRDREPAFPRLSQLIVKYCPDLASFPPCSILQTLYLQGNNEALRIRTSQITLSPSSCHDKIVGLTVEVDSVACLKSLVPQKPTNLIISNDHGLEKLSDVEELFRSCSSSLHTLNVGFCSKLTSLHGGLEHLASLHSLTLGYCGELKLDDNGGRGIPWGPLQNLRNLNLKCLEKLEVLPHGMHYLTRLQHLHIYGCDKLSVLPEWVSCFRSLQSFRIESCRALKFLPQAMSTLTSLQELKIFQCPDLKQICQKPSGEDWPKIQHIPQIYIQ